MRTAARALLLAALAACTGEEAPSGPATPQGPYVITAIDYHFHDAHPSDPVSLDRDVVFVNVGRNVHNVTFDEVEFDRDFENGERVTVDVEELLGAPGRYVFRCTYHLDRGMTGELLIV